MHAHNDFIVHLTLILISSGIGGYIATKLGFSKLVGRILAGIIIGPSVLALVSPNVTISNFAEIGIILLMFLAGLETNVEDLKKSLKSSSLIAIGGIVVPFLFGIISIFLIRDNFDFKEGIFLGIILTATSMGIIVQTLKEMKILNTKTGLNILGAAVFDDIIGVIILTFALSLFSGSLESVGSLILKIALFFTLTIFIGGIISRFILKNKRWFTLIRPKYILAYSLILVFVFALIASEFGMAMIIGSYFSGLIISETPLKERVTNEIENFGTAIFIPIFFVNIGLQINLESIWNYITVAIIITLMGILSKIIGASIGAKISGLKLKESLFIGVSMIPRAEVSLIISNLVYKLGFIQEDTFTAIILLVIVSTILSPWLLKKLQ